MTPSQPQRLTGARAICALLLFGISFPLLAQTSEPPGASGTAILQMLFGLALIIGVLFAGAYILRRLNGGRTFGHAGPMKIVGGLMVSARERILLVEVGDTWLVIGVVSWWLLTAWTLIDRKARGED